MTVAPSEIPNTLLTNTFVLYGFEEYVYMVFTIGRPPSHAPSQQEIPQGSNLARLRSAEKDLRRVGVLASLDAERGELFTFYRRSYVAKEQKDLISKFGPVVRRYHCINSYRTQGPIMNLLKPDQSRAYGLFVRAILASVQDSFHNGEGRISVGPRALVSRNTSGGWRLDSSNSLGIHDSWRYCALDVQVLTNGKVLISSLSQDFGIVRCSLDTFNGSHSGLQLSSTPLAICLAPIGQLARYTGGRVGCIPMHGHPQTGIDDDALIKYSDTLEEARQELWIKGVMMWLQDRRYAPASWDGQLWVEIEIPTAPVDAEVDTIAANNQVRWKNIFWPVVLCFTFPGHASIQPKIEEELRWASDDPWEFIQQWFETGEERERIASRNGVSKLKGRSKGEADADSENSEDNFQLDSTPHFQNLGPPDFPPSQLMYPTPPDVALTQATPGMSSMDGIEMTPANMIRNITDLTDDSRDEEMGDLGQVQGAGVGTGFYDEDLFEEMPADKFGPSGGADEPNWDFFDQPDLDMPDADNDEVEFGDQLKVDSENHDGHDTAAKLLGFDGTQGAASPLDCITALNDGEQNKTMRNDDLPRSPFDDVPVQDMPHVSTAGAAVSNKEDPTDPDPTGQEDIVQNENLVEEILLRRNSTNPGRRRSSYESVPMNLESVRTDRNYTEEGKYWFDTAIDSSELPGQSNTYTLPFFSGQAIHKLRPRTPSSSSSESESNFSDSFPNVPDLPNSPAEARQKWADYSPVLPENGVPTLDSVEMQNVRDEVGYLLDTLQVECFDLPVTGDILVSAKLGQEPIATNVEDVTTIAQILVDQLCQSFFQSKFESKFLLQYQTMSDPESSIKLFDSDGELERLDLHKLCKIGPTAEKEGVVERLKDFHVSLKRYEKPLEALPTIIRLWDTLGLQPRSGSKDITAYCVYPNGMNAENGCQAFLARISEVYISCSLGSHATGTDVGKTSNGLVSWSNEHGSDSPLVEICEQLGKDLAQAEIPDGTILIYLMNPLNELSSYVTLCNAFYSLFSEYRKACGKDNPCDIAFQIVPITFVASPETIVVPTQTEYLNLALEVYNRCPPTELGDDLAYYGSAVTIAHTWNKTTTFDFDTNFTSPIAKNGEILHLAYSQSLDKRWITAAWTDEQGYLALTMSYCLRLRNSSIWRPRSEVIKDIWDISRDLIGKHRTKWRLVVAKDSFYEAEEINDWSYLANNKGHDKKSTCSLVLISIELNPAFKLESSPLPIKAPQIAGSSQTGFTAGTPASTPQAANTTSPEQVIAATPTPTPANTAPINAAMPPDPSFDPTNDTDRVLTNPADESWSVLLSHGLNQSRNILDVRPAMSSGYVVKRCGPKDEDGFVSLGVNLIYTPIPAQEQEKGRS